MANSMNVEQPKLAEHDCSVLDLAFAMDCTGSMSSYIQAAKDGIFHICQEIVASEKSDIKLALVEYRDHPPQDNSFVTREHDFVHSIEQMKRWLSEASANGGGDAPEAVTDAMQQLLKLSWRENSTKICIMVSDAPPHGIDTCGDGFPNGCPAGLDPVAIARELASKGITLYTVGCGLSKGPTQNFFMTIAHITGGQHLPLKNASLLAKVIIGSAEEQINLEKLQLQADDVVNELTKGGKVDVSEEVISAKLQSVFGNVKTKQNFWAGANYAAPEQQERLSETACLSDYNKAYKGMNFDNVEVNEIDETFTTAQAPTSMAQCKRMAKKSKFAFFK